jgi:hypothetical protein
MPDDIISSSGEIAGIVLSAKDRNASNRSQQISTKQPLKFELNRASESFIVDDIYNNLVFHSDAFVLAMRPLTSSAAYNGLGNRMMSVTDPETGLSMRLEISRQYKQTVWEFDVLWGVEMVRPKWVMTEETVLLQHRFSDQFIKVSLSQYRRESCRRYRDWRLSGQGQFIAPPELRSVSAIQPISTLQRGFFLCKGYAHDKQLS